MLSYQFPYLLTRVLGCHDRLTHQDGVDADVSQLLNILPAGYPALTDDHLSFGNLSDNPEGGLYIYLKSGRSLVLMPMIRAAALSAFSSSLSSWTSTRLDIPSSSESKIKSERADGSNTAAIRRRASAPIYLDSYIWYSSKRKSFLSTGSAVFFFAMPIFSDPPEKNRLSVRTDIADAPASSYLLARSSTFRSEIRRPFDGELFLISAIRRIGLSSVFEDIAAQKSRGGATPRMCDLISFSGSLFRHSIRSSLLPSMIFDKIPPAANFTLPLSWSLYTHWVVSRFNASNFANAFPESIDSSAALIAAGKSEALPPAIIPAAALRRTISRLGPLSPSRIPRTIRALSSALPPRISSMVPVFIPKSPGRIL